MDYVYTNENSSIFCDMLFTLRANSYSFYLHYVKISGRFIETREEYRALHWYLCLSDSLSEFSSGLRPEPVSFLSLSLFPCTQLLLQPLNKSVLVINGKVVIFCFVSLSSFRNMIGTFYVCYIIVCIILYPSCLECSIRLTFQ